MSTVRKWKKANWNKLFPASLASDRKRINANNTACTTKTVPSCLNIPEDGNQSTIKSNIPLAKKFQNNNTVK
ncbi:hypothetical protein T06_8059 [Trichinella sp. T6]|nr:hypothetical protein T06_8059 [Trichinella sp. T6]